jgi:hypothetical protein
MVESELEQEQILFYEKVASYVSRHPEFVDELQRRMEEEEKIISEEKSEEKSKSYSGKENYDAGNENKDKKSKKGIFNLDEERINTISEELSGLLFDKDSSNKSVLEKTVQGAFSNMVQTYLSKYAE